MTHARATGSMFASTERVVPSPWSISPTESGSIDWLIRLSYDTNADRGKPYRGTVPHPVTGTIPDAALDSQEK